MRISDWSSDVCSSVLLRRVRTTRSGASIDPVGLCLLATTTGLLLWPIVTRTSVTVAAAFLIGAFGVAVAFWFWERRYAERGGTPVLLPSLIASRGFRLGTTVGLFWFGSILDRKSTRLNSSH